MNKHFDTYRMRLIAEEDAPGLFRLIEKNRIRLRDYFPNSIKSIVTEESALQYILEKTRQCQNKVFYCFVIESVKEGKELIGIVFLKNVEWTIPKAELAYFIDQDYERMGIITKSISFVITYSFDTLKLNKLYLRVSGDNKASQRVAEKNGFRTEGTLRSDFKTSDGKLIDLIYYGLLR
jgi:RimJ/RimL family protein N-acetyltransferase